MANDNAKAVTKANNDWTGRLYKQIAKPKENLIFSPLSVHTILSLVYQGSDGVTEEDMRNALGIPDKEKTADGFQNVMSELNSVENVTLKIANRVYYQEGSSLNPQFAEIATKQFFAGAESLKFTDANAAKSINGWVENNTNNKIKDLIKQDDLDESTRLVLVNAIYFKGDWLDQFKKENTKPEKFFISDTDTVPCSMMHRTGKYNYKEDPELDAQIIQLPYKNPALSMVIVLPKSKTGIDALEQNLTNYDLNKLTQDMSNLEVVLSLPKFKLESTIELNDPLKKLGLENAFSDAANFTKMLQSDEPLKISKAIQKAFIEVNEEGAEAAAATGDQTVNFCAPLPPIPMNVHHPFFIVLQKKAESVADIMFIGAIKDKDALFVLTSSEYINHLKSSVSTENLNACEIQKREYLRQKQRKCNVM